MFDATIDVEYVGVTTAKPNAGTRLPVVVDQGTPCVVRNAVDQLVEKPVSPERVEGFLGVQARFTFVVIPDRFVEDEVACLHDVFAL